MNITGLWPDELRKHDIGVVPEDRYKQGLCLDVPVSANLIAGYHGLKPYCNKGVMNRRAITENRDRLVEEYDVRLSTKDPAVGSLSGGNAQKVIIAREFSRRPKVLLVSQPTRGVDIGAIPVAVGSGVTEKKHCGKNADRRYSHHRYHAAQKRKHGRAH